MSEGSTTDEGDAVKQGGPQIGKQRTPWTALFSAARDGDCQAITELLRTAGADVAATNSSNGWTPLHAAASCGRTDACRLLAAAGAPIDAAGTDGGTPLLAAVACGHVDASRALLECGADVTRADQSGATPLVLAARFGHSVIVEALIDAGADPNDERHPLHEAAANGKVRAVEVLVRHGANTESLDSHGRTALRAAAEEGHVSAVKALLNLGALANPIDKAGRTPLAVATTRGHADVARVLFESGGTVSDEIRGQLGRLLAKGAQTVVVVPSSPEHSGGHSWTNRGVSMHTVSAAGGSPSSSRHVAGGSSRERETLVGGSRKWASNKRKRAFLLSRGPSAFFGLAVVAAVLSACGLAVVLALWTVPQAIASNNAESLLYGCNVVAVLSNATCTTSGSSDGVKFSLDLWATLKDGRNVTGTATTLCRRADQGVKKGDLLSCWWDTKRLRFDTPTVSTWAIAVTAAVGAVVLVSVVSLVVSSVFLSQSVRLRNESSLSSTN